jgi:hypothetical protein
MVAASENAGRGVFGQAFASACALCLQVIPEARRLEDLEDMREKATSLAWCARRAGNAEAQRQSEEIRELAERRIRPRKR